MFYAHFVLSKKGPLARIWLAAHWDKKLTRSQVFETNITSSVEAILEPKVKLALRTSGHLLLGVVRIHSRQAKYLLSDCNEAFVKIKMAFRPGADIADDCHRDTTSLANITLNEMNDFESTLADINDIDPFGIAVNQSRPEDITMREEFGEPNLGRPDDDFGDSTFEDAAGDRDFVVEQMNMDSMEEHNEVDMTLTNELVKNSEAASSHVFPEMPSSVGGLMGNNDSDFADVMDYDSDSVENLDMFQDTVVTHPVVSESMMNSGVVDSRLLDSTVTSSSTTGILDAGHSMPSNASGAAGDDSGSSVVLGGAQTGPMGSVLAPVQEEDDSSSSLLFGTGGAILAPRSPGMGPDTVPVVTASPQQPLAMPLRSATATVTRMMPVDMPAAVAAAVLAHRAPYSSAGAQDAPGVAVQLEAHAGTTEPHNTRLPQFVLPPIDRSVRENRRVPKRKLRKLLIDEHKSIPSEIMKLQMQDTSEITTRLDLAPPTRKLMLWKETGNVEALFAAPGRAIPSRVLQKLFYRNMKTVPVPNDAPGGLPVIPGLRRRPGIGGLLSLDDDEDDDEQEPRDHEDDDRPPVAREPLNAISEADGEEDGATRASGGGGGDTGMPPDGACSSYSANYDCWSTHGGDLAPVGGDQGDGDIGDQSELGTVTVMMPVTTVVSVVDEHGGDARLRSDGDGDGDPQYHGDGGVESHLPAVEHQHQLHDVASDIDTAAAATSATVGGKADLISSAASPSLIATGMSPLSQSVSSSLLLDMSIHKAREYSSFGSAEGGPIGIGGGSDGGGGPGRLSHNDISIGLNASVDRSVISSTGGGGGGGGGDCSRSYDERADTTLTSADFVDVDMGIDNGPGNTSNKLQTTMVMLDQQLDKVNEEYPLEITQEGLEKRSEIMLNVLRNAIKREGQVNFHHLTVSNNKKQAASKFYTLLLLAKQKKLTMVQETPFSNIIITRVEPDSRSIMDLVEEVA